MKNFVLDDYMISNRAAFLRFCIFIYMQVKTYYKVVKPIRPPIRPRVCCRPPLNHFEAISEGWFPTTLTTCHLVPKYPSSHKYLNFYFSRPTRLIFVFAFVIFSYQISFYCWKCRLLFRFGSQVYGPKTSHEKLSFTGVFLVFIIFLILKCRYFYGTFFHICLCPNQESIVNPSRSSHIFVLFNHPTDLAQISKDDSLDPGDLWILTLSQNFRLCYKHQWFKGSIAQGFDSRFRLPFFAY